MKAIVECPATTKDAKPRRWQVPVNLVELSRLSSALLAAKRHGVESKLVLDGDRLMRTKRAEARLAMLYVACEQRHDPAAWVKCRHELQLDPALGGLLPHLYRGYDEALAEDADENLLNDAQAMKLKLAATDAEVARLAAEEQRRQERLAKKAENEEHLKHQLTLRKLARCELDTSRAFRKWSSQGKRKTILEHPSPFLTGGTYAGGGAYATCPALCARHR